MVNIACSRFTEVFNINGVEIYESLGSVGGTAQEELHRAALGRILLVNGRYIHTKDKLHLNREQLSQRIQRLVPEPDGKAVIVLDWEGPRMTQLIRGAAEQDDLYQAAKTELLAAYHLVKELRPGTTVGFYGFPERNYWNRDEKWRKRNDGMRDFLKETDALFPSIYDFYATTDKNRADEIAYVRDNTEEAVRMAVALRKPVYPFVWHRYHESNKKLSRQLIPEAQFEEHVRAIATTTYDGKKIDGLVWWSSERYFYNIGPSAKKSTEAFDRENSPITLRYFRALKRAL